MSQELTLAVEETEDLDRLESIVERGKTTFVEVGEALREIKERKLYRDFGTWDQYCESRFGFTRQHAGRQIKASKLAIATKKGTNGSVLPSESIARPMIQA